MATSDAGLHRVDADPEIARQRVEFAGPHPLLVTLQSACDDFKGRLRAANLGLLSGERQLRLLATILLTVVATGLCQTAWAASQPPILFVKNHADRPVAYG
jgi:hypothetical protein